MLFGNHSGLIALAFVPQDYATMDRYVEQDITDMGWEPKYGSFKDLKYFLF